MPLRNQPAELRKSAMVCIVHNFDLICYSCRSRDEMRRIISDESYLLVEGPFRHLPSSILSEMIVLLADDAKVRHVKRFHFHHLLQPHLESLSLSSANGDTHFALELIHDRCKNLRRLDLSYLRNIGPPILIRLMPKLCHLVTLNLSMTETVDQALAMIGLHCHELRDLDISHCPITDAGLPRLCYNKDSEKSQCQKLFKLSIVGCEISASSVAFLLQHVPTLNQLDFENIFQVFDVMVRMGFTCENSCSKFQLRSLTSSTNIVTSLSVDVAFSLCPFVTTVTVNNALIGNAIVFKAMDLDHLAHLKLTNCDELTLDFQDSVLPFLVARGQQLVTLLLAKFTWVDVAAIGEWCPNLQNLALSTIGEYEEMLCPKESYFHHLIALELWTELTVETLSCVLLKQLLTFSVHLRNLLIRSSISLSDKLLHEIWRSNPMVHLSRLTLDNCPNVTMASMETVLDCVNELTLLRVWGCFLVTKEDSEEMQRKIRKNNSDMYLQWYPWEG